jgi:serine carboxypeptidase 1
MTNTIYNLQDLYNFMLDAGMDPVAAADLPATSSSSPTPSNVQAMKYSTYLGGSLGTDSNTLGGIMNGVIKEKLKIIPKDVQ